MSKHALLIENLELDQAKADEIVKVLKEFALELGYSKDRIDSLECRSRDGFIPYNHNYGGIGCVAFAFPFSLPNGCTGFPNADATLEKYDQYDRDNYSKDIGKPEKEWNERDYEGFSDCQSQDDQASILYSLDMMHTGIENGLHTLNLRFCVCVKDMPYHRQFDDKIELDLTFKTVNGLKGKLNKLLKRKEIKQFITCLRDAY